MTASSSTDRAQKDTVSPPSFEAMAWIPDGTYLMSSDDFFPEERPVHRVAVDGFWMDEYPVTNAPFRRFIEATGYVTVAARPPNASDYPGIDAALLVPGSLVFLRPMQRVPLYDYRQWWAYVPGACWKHSEGPASTLDGRDLHPVVHVAYEDAGAYARSTSLPRTARHVRWWCCVCAGGHG